MTISGEKLDKLNELLSDENDGKPAKEHEPWCPCIPCYNRRRREEEVNRDQPEMSYEQYVDEKIMGYDPDDD